MGVGAVLLFLLALVVVDAAVPPAVQETVLDGELKMLSSGSYILWTGTGTNADKWALVLTESGTVYRSQDEGSSWQALNPGLVGASTPVTYPGGSTHTGVSTIVSSPENVAHILLVGYSNHHWHSSDGGATFNEVSTNNVVDYFTHSPLTAIADFHPLDPSWLLIATASSGCWHSTGDCFRTIERSKDGGKTFQIMATYVMQFSWSSSFGGHIVSPADTFEAIEFATKRGDQTYNSRTSVTNLMRYAGSTSTKVLDNAVGFLLMDPYYFVAQKPTSEASSTTSYVLVVSRDSGATYSPVVFPASVDLDYLQFIVLDVSFGAISVAVQHSSDGWGNVYTSDSHGSYFSLALEYVAMSGGHAGFTPLESLAGLFVANLVDPDSTTGHLTTVYSANNGGDWFNVAPPLTNSGGQPFNCDGCSLQLAGPTVDNSLNDGSLKPTASAGAVGIVLAIGNVGKYVWTNQRFLESFMTRDGGMTWSQTLPGANYFGIGDHGGILLAAAISSSPVTSAFYSVDEGNAWLEAPFSTQGMIVNMILSPPRATGAKFPIAGTRVVDGDTSLGVIATIDFSNVFPRVCVASDYYTWSPGSVDGTTKGACVMGQTYEYSRRLQGADCLNTEASEFLKVVSTPCPCTENDIECDYGYTRVDNEGEAVCVKASPVDGGSGGPTEDEPPSDCPPGSEYTVTRGYRIVAGDACDPDGSVVESKLPLVYKCPEATPPKKGTSAGNVVLILLLIVVVLGLAFGLYANRTVVIEQIAAWRVPVLSANFAYGTLDNAPDTVGFSHSSDGEGGEDDEGEAGGEDGPSESDRRVRVGAKKTSQAAQILDDDAIATLAASSVAASTPAPQAAAPRAARTFVITNDSDDENDDNSGARSGGGGGGAGATDGLESLGAALAAVSVKKSADIV